MLIYRSKYAIGRRHQLGQFNCEIIINQRQENREAE